MFFKLPSSNQQMCPFLSSLSSAFHPFPPFSEFRLSECEPLFHCAVVPSPSTTPPPLQTRPPSSITPKREVLQENHCRTCPRHTPFRPCASAHVLPTSPR